jgi:hypothetical protein
VITGYSVETLNNLPSDTSSEVEQIAKIANAVDLPLTVHQIEIDGMPFRRDQVLNYGGSALAQIAYLDPTHGPIALCILEGSPGKMPPQVEQRHGMNIVYWSTRSHSLMVIGWNTEQAIWNVSAKRRQTLPL